MMVHHLNDHLTHTLGGAHDVGGIHGFVRGNQYETLDAVLVRRHGRLVGAEYVVLDGLVGAVLHERDMLMRRRMVYNIWTVFFKNAVDTVLISHRSDQNHQIQLRIIPLQLLLNIIGVIFIDIYDDQALGGMRCHLTAQLASDGSAAAGNQDGLAGHIAHDGVQLNPDGLPAQQILDLYFTELGDTDLAFDHLIETRQHLQLAAGVLTDIQDFFSLGLGRGGHGYDNLVDIHFPHQAVDILSASGNLDTAQVLALLGGIVVNDAADFLIQKTAVLELLDDHGSGLAAAYDHGVLAFFLGVHIAALLQHP